MAEKLTTPSCELTDLPLPVRNTEPSKGAQFLFNDYHHHFHPKLDPSLQEMSGKAVRYSRGQFLPRQLHTYYHEMFSGPALPTNSQDKFRASILACAGVVPREAIDVSSRGEYKVVSLSKQEHAMMASAGSVFAENEKAAHPIRQAFIARTIGQFFARFALEQNIQGALSDGVIDEFLATPSSAARKKELGNFIVQEALGLAIEDVIPIHNEARQEGLISPQFPYRRIRQVVSAFCMNRYFPDYYEDIAKTLVLQSARPTELSW